MYKIALTQNGSIRKAAESLGLTKSKFMVLLKKEQGLCTATTSCQEVPKAGCTRCEKHLRYAFKTQDRDKKKLADKAWSQNNKEHRAKYHKKYQQDNRESVNARNRKYSKTEKGMIVNRAKRAYRRAMQIQATPPWVDRAKLKEIYKNCPKGHHVDHIIPLDNELVCGLHVPWNLQYLSSFDNDSKGNKWDGTYDNKNWSIPN
jgi:5-methylcytosine-specific restriction endonuclease McrA